MEKYKMLTIGVTFCDKDAHLVENILQDIQEHVKVNYSLIVVDNRKNKTSLPFQDLITYSCDDQGCFIPRRKSVDLINSEYVWWVDADDRIVLDITPEFFKSNADIITFKGITTTGQETGTWPNRAQKYYAEDLIYAKFNSETWHILGPNLWNKFIKAYLFKKIKDIPEFIGVCNEDNFIVTYLMKYIKTIKCINISPYTQDMSASDLRSQNVSLEAFKRLCVDQGKMYDYTKQLFSEQDLEDCKEWFCPEHSCRALFHLMARSPEEIIPEEWSLLQKEFSLNIVKNVIKRFLIY